MDQVINRNIIIDYMMEQPDIAAAYIFGSFARGRARHNSDVDIAVLFDLPGRDKSARFDRRLEMEIALEEMVKRQVQVVDLETAHPVLQRQVRKYGQLLVEKNPRRRITFEVASRRHYFDMQRVYRLRNAAILNALEGQNHG